MTRIDAALRVANLDTLLKLTAASTPARADLAVYFMQDAGDDLGRWAQYRATSTATPGDDILYPLDIDGDPITDQGRWHLFKAGDPLPEGLLDAEAHAALEPADCHPPKVEGFTGDPDAYTPAAAGQLLVATDTNQLYRSTGTTAGALAEVGSPPGRIPASDTAPTAAPPILDPGDGLAEVQLQTGAEPRLWIGLDPTGTDGLGGWGFVSINLAEPTPDLDTDAAAWLARTAGTYSTPEQEAISDFFAARKAVTMTSGGNGLAALDAFWLCCVDVVGDSRLNFLGIDYTIVDTGVTFTAREGVFYPSSDYGQSGIIPLDLSASPIVMMGAYARIDFPDDSEADDGVWQSGESSDTSSLRFNGLGGDAILKGKANGDLFSFTVAGAVPRGAGSVCRDSTNIFGVVNQSVSGTVTADATDIPEFDEMIFGFTSANEYAARWYSAAEWTAAEVQQLHAHVEALVDAFGAGVVS